jgi:cation diffusion facilitator family transporter
MFQDHHSDIKEGLRVTVVGSVINLVLSVLKVVLGVMGHSRALVADGVHSLTDLVSDMIVVWGLLVGAKPRDRSHHYGHGKVETLAEMGLGTMLILAGLAIIFDSVKAIAGREVGPPMPIVIPAAVASIVLKEWLYWVTIREARRTESPALVANAWHHRSDAMTSVGVLIGVGLAILFPKFAIADALVGFMVAGVVIRIGGGIAWKAGTRIIDTAPSEDYMSKVTGMILTVEGVRSVRDLRMRHVGRLIAVEVHLGLDPEMSVLDSHDLAREVKRYVMEKDRGVFDVLVHVEPEEQGTREGEKRRVGEGEKVP